MFEILSSKNIYHANDIDKIFDSQVDKSFPYVVRTTQSNGIRGYIIKNDLYANDGNTLSFTQDTFSVFYQKQKYFTGNKVKVLKAKFKNKSEGVMKYLTACFQKSLDTFTWGIGSTVETIAQTKIQLPIKNGKIDFKFMESFIMELETNHITEIEANHMAEIEAYLSTTGLKDYTLTNEEQQVLDDFEQGMIKFKEFKISDLFEKIKVKSLKYKTGELPSEAINEFILPALTAGVKNQGLNNFVPKDNATILKNVISISANGKNTGATFYQNKEFTVLQDAYAIRWKHMDNLLTDNHYLYLTSSISKTIFGNYEWTNKAGWERVKSDKIKLPIKNGKIDFEFMENFISVIQKLAIKDVVLYANKKLDATKRVINRDSF